MKRQVVGQRALPMALVLLTGMGGCKAPDRNAARDSTAMATTPADTGASAASSGATAARKGGMTDSNIVAILDGANKVDSANGAIASKKATRADVKA
jgi:hypothetical protein